MITEVPKAKQSFEKLLPNFNITVLPELTLRPFVLNYLSTVSNELSNYLQ